MWKNIDPKNSKHGHILCSEHLKKQVSYALVRKLQNMARNTSEKELVVKLVVQLVRSLCKIHVIANFLFFIIILA